MTAILSPPALAQLLEPNVTVLSRQRPDYAPIGGRVSGFLLYPKLGLDGGYDDNVFARNHAIRGDYIMRIRPEVLINSDWNVHALRFRTGADIGRYHEITEQDYEDYFAIAKGIINIRHDRNVQFNAQYSRGHESRDSPDDFPGVTPTLFRNAIFGTAYFHEFGRVQLKLNGTIKKWYFANGYAANGLAIDNNDRDRVNYTTGGELHYDWSPRLSVYTNGKVIYRRYEEDFDRFGFTRDSDGYRVGLGTNFVATGNIFGNLWFGYMSEDYDDHRLDSIGGPMFNGEVSWTPTGLTTISAGFGRTIQPTTRNNSSGQVLDEYELTIDHELLRNLLLQLNALYLMRDFKGNTREDNNYNFGFNATYLMNRWVNITLKYDWNSRDTNVSGFGNAQDFTKNKVWLGAEFQF